ASRSGSAGDPYHRGMDDTAEPSPAHAQPDEAAPTSLPAAADPQVADARSGEWQAVDPESAEPRSDESQAAEPRPTVATPPSPPEPAIDLSILETIEGELQAVERALVQIDEGVYEGFAGIDYDEP